MAEVEEAAEAPKEVAEGGNCCWLVCPCCCHPAHKGKLTPRSGAACCCWTLVGGAIGVCVWALLVFVVLQKLVICPGMETELFPEKDWLQTTAARNPSNWEFAGSQLEHCAEWMRHINVTDWRVNASEYQEVFFESSDGLRLQGFLLLGQNGGATGVGRPQDAPTIIQVHGHGPYVGQQSQMVPAKAMQQQGFNVFVFNNQGLGKSEAPPTDYATRAFGTDEITNTEGAIRAVTENPGGILPFATPLQRVGIYTESGGNGMVLFFRRAIPGIVMHGSIYDWYAQWQKVAGENGIGWIPMVATAFMNCASEKAQGGGLLEENYKDQLQKGDVYDPSGRKVLLIHNRADEYNLFDDHAPGWKKDLGDKGFEVTTHFPDEDGEDSCNSHITIFYARQRKAHFKLVCEFWEQVFNVSASCASVLAFDPLA